MAEKSIYDKLATVQQTLKAPKNQYNSFGKYHYRSCEDILEGLKEPLSKVGACVTIGDEIVEIAGRVYVKATARFITADGSIENVAYAREPETKTGMDLAQLTGATSSYARKYALNGLFLIDDNKDADTDEQANETKARASKSNVERVYKENKPSKAKMAETEKKYIDEKKQKALSAKCESDGVHPVMIMEKCKIQDFSQITEKQFAWICANWTKEFVNGNQS